MNKRPAQQREALNLWLSVAGQGVSGLGHYLFSFAMGLYVLSLTGSAQSYAVTVAVSLLPSALLSPLVGALADRLNKKLLVVLSDALNCLLLVSAFLVTLIRPLTVTDVYLITLCMSVLSPFVNVAFTAAGPQLVSDKQLSRLTSYRSAVTSVIQVATPVLSGAVYVAVDVRLFVLFSGIAFGLSALSELFIDFRFNPLPADRQKQETFWAALRGGATYVLTSRLLLALIILVLLINLWFAGFNVVLPFSILEIIGLDETTYGLIMAAFSVGNLLGSIYVGRRDIRFSRRLVTWCVALIAALFVWMAVPIGLPFSRPLAAVQLFLACTLIGLTCSFVNITSNVFIQRTVPGELLGRVGGLFGMANMCISPVGTLLFGALADHIHPSLILVACAVCMFVIAFFCRRLTSLDGPVASVPQ